jgi:putative peptide zinc metalloprotease protein
MAESQFSTLWYRVAELRPRLRSHVELRRHHYRGQLWYVIQDHASGRVHRFTPAAFSVIGLMNGKRTVQELWDLACERLQENTPSQDEVIRLLGQLHAADVLQSDVPPDAAELFERYQRQRRTERFRPLLSPMAVKIPVFDPENFLNRFSPLVRPLFTRAGFVIWLIIVFCGIVLAARHWPELTRDIADRVLAPEGLLLLSLIFPVVKGMHELGHAFALKAWGGEVHEMGIMLLVLFPIPYVDASASSAFHEKRRRAAVGAAGMMTELLIASIALVVWTLTEPGLVRAICYNIVLIAGVSTVVFNANPLLRFDGYYIFSDLIEIPNLSQRATRHWSWLAQNHLLRLKDIDMPPASPGERRWFLFYGPASLFYRLFISIRIALFLAGKFFVFGVLLAIWSAITILVIPVFQGFAFAFASPKINEKKVLAWTLAVILILSSLGFLFGVPLPLHTHAEGIVWVPDRAIVCAETSGFWGRLLTPTGAIVKSNEPLAEFYDPALVAEIKKRQARLSELEAQRSAVFAAGERVQSEVIVDQMKAEQANLARDLERAEGLVLRAHTEGVLVVPQSMDMEGRFVKKGEQLGYVFGQSEITVRVVVPQRDIDLVRRRTRKVLLRPAENLGEILQAEIRREVPAGSDQLPSKALTREGGGGIAVDPRDGSGLKSLSRYFQLELALPSSDAVTNIGSHVYVRFDHGVEPLGFQWYRRIRQLFLSRFNA